MSRLRRGAWFVDPSVQGRLAWRVVSYWFFCLLAVELLIACWLVWIDRPSSSLELVGKVMEICALPFAASILLLPMVAFDMIRFSHRFVGPMVRLRRGMNDLAEGRPTMHVVPRNGDLWREFADDYNRVVDRVEQLEQQLREADKHELEPWQH